MMFDEFEPLQLLKKHNFIFQPTRYETWMGGRMFSCGNTFSSIVATVINCEGKEKIEVTFNDNNLNYELAIKNIFDMVFTGKDRIRLTTIPEHTNSECKGITSLRMAVGATRHSKNFLRNEPYCGNFFLKNGIIAKITFSYSNPIKLLELYNDNIINDSSTDVSEDLQTSSEPEIVSLAQRAITQCRVGNVTSSRQLLIRVYRSVKSAPKQLGSVTSYSLLGTSFLMMLERNISSNIDTLQTIASLGYLCISKAIENDKLNLSLYRERLILLGLGQNTFTYTVMAALNIIALPFGIIGAMAPLKAENAILKMKIADLELNSELYQQEPVFNEKRKKIGKRLLLSGENLDKIIQSGVENHIRLLRYLENRVINQGDIDFYIE